MEFVSVMAEIGIALNKDSRLWITFAPEISKDACNYLLGISDPTIKKTHAVNLSAHDRWVLDEVSKKEVTDPSRWPPEQFREKPRRFLFPIIDNKIFDESEFCKRTAEFIEKIEHFKKPRMVA